MARITQGSRLYTHPQGGSGRLRRGRRRGPCSIVFEAEPEGCDLMTRPPRPVSDSPFAAAPLMQGVLQGLGVALVRLAGQAWLELVRMLGRRLGGARRGTRNTG